MLKVKETLFIPIGCSCINQFQLEYAFPEGENVWGLFDWNIVTPQTTAAMFELSIKNDLMRVLLSKEAYTREASYGLNRLRHSNFAGLYFWHEEQESFRSAQEFFVCNQDKANPNTY